MLNIVVPMAGRGSRFADVGYMVPKPLIQVGGKPMIQWVIENVRPTRNHRFIFLCLAEHLRIYPDIEPSLKRICPGCEVIAVQGVTQGAACTVLLAKEFINSEQPLMIANSDQYVDISIDKYLAAMGPDDSGLIMTFRSNHPKWSYCRMAEDGTVTEVVEKVVVSNEATVGIYNFACGSDFVSAAEEMIAEDFRVNGEFYVAPAYNRLIACGKRVGVVNIGCEGTEMEGLGTPEDLDRFCLTRGIAKPPKSL